MRRMSPILLGVFLATLASIGLANGQQNCGGPNCNATHTGCEFKQSQPDRPCCCNVSCNQSGCTCTTKCTTGCQFQCPNCNTCSGASLATNVVPFKVPQSAIDQLSKDFPVAEMILANVSDHYKNPIYTNRVAGGTTVINQPRGFRYKGILTTSAEALTLDLVFLVIPATDPAADGSTTPFQQDQPTPAPTRIQIDQAGNVVMSTLAADVGDSIRQYEPPKCEGNPFVTGPGSSKQ